MKYFLLILVSSTLLLGCKSHKVNTSTNSTTDVETAWVSHPVAKQCEEVYYPSIDSAKSFLENNKVEVLEIKKMQLMVCAACGCPSSGHYIAKIYLNKIDNAKTLGWKTFNNPK